MPRSLPICLLAVSILAVAVPSRGQDGTIEPETDWDKRDKPTRALRIALFKGETRADPSKKEHAAAIDFAAKEATYQLHWYANDRKMGKINSIVADFDARLNQMHRNKNKADVAAMVAAYCRAVTTRARDVILAGNPIASVNAARVLYLISARSADPKGMPGTTRDWSEEVLPRLAGDTGDYLLTTLAELTASPRTNQGTKYYLLRAMGDILSLPRQTPPVYKKEPEEKAVSAALGFLAARTGFTLSTPRDELEGYKVLRGHALRVLAAAGHSELGKEKPALWMARVAGGDALIDPYPRLDERVEGAVGLARMIGVGDKRHPDLAFDLAAHQVAITVAVFALEAQHNIGAKTAARLRPWKADASRLLEAVEAMRPNKDAHVVAVVEKCRPILAELEAGRQTDAAANTLRDWIVTNPPPSKTLFKSDKTSTVLMEREPEPKDEKVLKGEKPPVKDDTPPAKDGKGKDGPPKKDGKTPAKKDK